MKVDCVGLSRLGELLLLDVVLTNPDLKAELVHYKLDVVEVGLGCDDVRRIDDPVECCGCT